MVLRPFFGRKAARSALTLGAFPVNGRGVKQLTLAIGFSAALFSSLAAETLPQWKRTQITREFWAEGAHFGDFTHDGKLDVVSGPFWYEAPDFQKRHEFYPANASFKRKLPAGGEETVPGFEGALGHNNAYSDCFLTYAWDFNQDGWCDVMVFGFPGTPACWYENPKGREGHWEKHAVLQVLDNESPMLVDVTGDGKPEILCCSEGYLGYAEADWKRPSAPWEFHAVSPKGDYQRYSHGIGVGDINGDGRMDILDREAWWEQPAEPTTKPWTRHPFAFAPAAAQMLVYDVNGDGLNDVITCVNAHGYGLSWFEQVREGANITFKEHTILNKDATPEAHGVSFSQPHALDLVDIDGDGLKDIVTGKRFWAHGPDGDPDPNGRAVLYWFQLKRGAGGQAEFIPHLVDSDSGVGTQVTGACVTNAKRPDILVGNKKGLFLFQQK